LKKSVKSIIFDFDYTLADSSVGVIDCVNSALAAMGLPLAAPGPIRRAIGLPLATTFRDLTGDLSGKRENDFVRLFTERADLVMAELTHVFDTVAPVVSTLKGRSFTLGIVSTKFRYRIQDILARAGLEDAFGVIIGGEDVPVHKPDPEGLLTAIDRLGCMPENVVYVGDSVTDAETARRADAPLMAVLSGVTPKEEFAPYPVVSILDGLLQLPGELSF
jgi:phosphoglycolate phosphatase